jgi:hypothetical protein
MRSNSNRSITPSTGHAVEHLKVEFPATGRMHLLAVTDLPNGPSTIDAAGARTESN